MAGYIRSPNPLVIPGSHQVRYVAAESNMFMPVSQLVFLFEAYDEYTGLTWAVISFLSSCLSLDLYHSSLQESLFTRTSRFGQYSHSLRATSCKTGALLSWRRMGVDLI